MVRDLPEKVIVDGKKMAPPTKDADNLFGQVDSKYPHDINDMLETCNIDDKGPRSVAAVPRKEMEDRNRSLALLQCIAGHKTETASLDALLFIIAQRTTET